MYTFLMDKRFDNQRPLCLGDNNTCTNLAGKKEIRNGKQRYNTLCDRHRRHGHSEMYRVRSKKSRRFVPLDSCDMCNEKAEERHRILKGATYDKFHVLTLCKPCHIKIHKLYKKFEKMGVTLHVKMPPKLTTVNRQPR